MKVYTFNATEFFLAADVERELRRLSNDLDAMLQSFQVLSQTVTDPHLAAACERIEDDYRQRQAQRATQ